jgi:hypothetical protein
MLVQDESKLIGSHYITRQVSQSVQQVL